MSFVFKASVFGLISTRSEDNNLTCTPPLARVCSTSQGLKVQNGQATKTSEDMGKEPGPPWADAIAFRNTTNSFGAFLTTFGAVPVSAFNMHKLLEAKEVGELSKLHVRQKLSSTWLSCRVWENQQQSCTMMLCRWCYFTQEVRER